VLILSGGRVVADLPPEELRNAQRGDLEGLFRNLTEDRSVEERAAAFLNQE
jgi:hypothetical protein